MTRWEQVAEFPGIQIKDNVWYFGENQILDVNSYSKKSNNGLPQPYIDFGQLPANIVKKPNLNVIRPFDDCFALCDKDRIIIYDWCELLDCAGIRPIVFEPKMIIKAKVKPVEYKKDHQSPVEHYAIEKLYDMKIDKETRNIKYRFFKHNFCELGNYFDTGFLLKTGVGCFVWYIINSTNGNFRKAFYEENYTYKFTQMEIGMEELEQCLQCDIEKRNNYLKQQYSK